MHKTNYKRIAKKWKQQKTAIKLQNWAIKSLLIGLAISLGLYLLLLYNRPIQAKTELIKTHCSQEHYIGEVIDNKWKCDLITNY